MRGRDRSIVSVEMLRSLTLKNYRCFRSATVTLEPLTAFVGPNASGKTSLLRAVAGPPRASDIWRKDPTATGEVVYEYTDKPEFRSEFSSTRHGARPGHAGERHQFDVREMRKQRQVQEQVRLSPDGSNLVNVFATLSRRQQDTLAKELCQLVPVLNDVNVRPGGAGHYRFVFQDRWDGDVWYEAHDVSDGTILTLALLAMAYQQDPPDVVGIEDPDHGLHPYLLEGVVALLRELTRGEVGSKPVQVVVATQSPELLEYLEPHEVRFLSRDPENGSVRIESPPTDTDNWRQAYTEHQESLGSLWLSGGAGGVPGG